MASGTLLTLKFSLSQRSLRPPTRTHTVPRRTASVSGPAKAKLDWVGVPRVQASAGEEPVVIRFGEAHADGYFFDRVRLYLSREQARALSEALSDARNTNADREDAKSAKRPRR